MSNILYPDTELLKRWGMFLSEVDFPKKYLPQISEEWAMRMNDCFEIVRLHPDRDDLCLAASRVFFKITKKHARLDGNKRSALICTYLFLWLNDYYLTLNHKSMYLLARRVARSSSRGKNDEKWIRRIRDAFKPCLVSISK